MKLLAQIGSRLVLAAVEKAPELPDLQRPWPVGAVEPERPGGRASPLREAVSAWGAVKGRKRTLEKAAVVMPRSSDNASTSLWPL